MTLIRKNKDMIHSDQEQASISGSKGSMTVEAALSIPPFLFAVLCLLFLLEIQATQIHVRSAAQSAAKKAAEEMAVFPVLNPFRLKSDMVQLMDARRLERSMIEGGSTGIQCFTSWYQQDTGELHIHIGYTLRLPFPGFLHLGIRQQEEFTVKAWTGYERPKLTGEEGQIVYITDTGGVYHEDYQCTYLQLSIRFIPFSGISDVRNLGGGRYGACEKCVHGGTMAGVYITDSGNRYHHSLGCSGLKRSIRAVKKSEVSGRRGCSRCSG